MVLLDFVSGLFSQYYLPLDTKNHFCYFLSLYAVRLTQREKIVQIESPNRRIIKQLHLCVGALFCLDGVSNEHHLGVDEIP
jgi:hypothetical protein